MEEVTFTAALALLPPDGAALLSFCDLAPASKKAWEKIALEYAPDTVHIYTPDELSFALPLPQLGCLMEEGPFKEAVEDMNESGVNIGGRWLLFDFEWEGARCGRVIIKLNIQMR